jgi:zinc protease
MIRALLAALAALFLVPAASAQTVPASPAAEEVRTPAGVRLVHYHLPAETEQAFSWWWRDRHAVHSLDKAGLIALAPGLLATGGTKRLDAGALEEEFKDFGVSFGLSRNRTATLGELAGPAENIAEGARLLGEILSTPRFPAINLKRRQRGIIRSRAAGRNNGEAIAREALTLAIAGASPLAKAVNFQPPSTVTDVSIDDVENWWRAVLARSNLTVVSAGPLPRAETERLVDIAFGALPAEGETKPQIPFEPRRSGKTVVIRMDVPQSILLMGAPVVWSGSAAEGVSRSIAMQALGGSSSSRLFVAIRERLGAAYGASSSIGPFYREHSIFAMQAAVAHEKLQPARAAMRAEYDAFRATGVRQALVEANKRRLLASQADTLRKARAAANAIRGGLLNGLGVDYLARVPDWINGQTADAINMKIRERLPEELLTVIVTPAADGIEANCVIAEIEALETCFAN